MISETRARKTVTLSRRLKNALICWSFKYNDEADNDPSKYTSIRPSRTEHKAVTPPRYQFPSPPPSPPPSYEDFLRPGYDIAVPRRPAITSKKLPPRENQRPTAPIASISVANHQRNVNRKRPRRRKNKTVAPVALSVTHTKSKSSPPLTAMVIVSEVINAIFVQDGTASSIGRQGFLALHFQASVIGALHNVRDGSLKFVLSNAAMINSISTKNFQLSRELHETPTEKTFVIDHHTLVSHLRQLHKNDPEANFYRAIVANYKIHTKLRDSTVYPLTLSAQWFKASATLVILDLIYRPKAVAIKPTQPLGSVEILVQVPSTWRFNSSHPTTTADKITMNGVYWSINKLEDRANVLVAKFDVDPGYVGQYKGKVSARFNCKDATFSGVKLDVTHVKSNWPIRDVRMSIKSGNYHCYSQFAENNSLQGVVIDVNYLL